MSLPPVGPIRRSNSLPDMSDITRLAAGRPGRGHRDESRAHEETFAPAPATREGHGAPAAPSGALVPYTGPGFVPADGLPSADAPAAAPPPRDPFAQTEQVSYCKALGSFVVFGRTSSAFNYTNPVAKVAMRVLMAFAAITVVIPLIHKSVKGITTVEQQTPYARTCDYAAKFFKGEAQIDRPAHLFDRHFDQEAVQFSKEANRAMDQILAKVAKETKDIDSFTHMRIIHVAAQGAAMKAAENLGLTPDQREAFKKVLIEKLEAVECARIATEILAGNLALILGLPSFVAESSEYIRGINEELLKQSGGKFTVADLAKDPEAKKAQFAKAQGTAEVLRKALNADLKALQIPRQEAEAKLKAADEAVDAITLIALSDISEETVAAAYKNSEIEGLGAFLRPIIAKYKEQAQRLLSTPTPDGTVDELSTFAKRYSDKADELTAALEAREAADAELDAVKEKQRNLKDRIRMTKIVISANLDRIISRTQGILSDIFNNRNLFPERTVEERDGQEPLGLYPSDKRSFAKTFVAENLAPSGKYAGFSREEDKKAHAARKGAFQAQLNTEAHFAEFYRRTAEAEGSDTSSETGSIGSASSEGSDTSSETGSSVSREASNVRRHHFARRLRRTRVATPVQRAQHLLQVERTSREALQAGIMADRVAYLNTFKAEMRRSAAEAQQQAVQSSKDALLVRQHWGVVADEGDVHVTTQSSHAPVPHLEPSSALVREDISSLVQELCNYNQREDARGTLQMRHTENGVQIHQATVPAVGHSTPLARVHVGARVPQALGGGATPSPLARAAAFAAGAGLGRRVPQSPQGNDHAQATRVAASTHVGLSRGEQVSHDID